MAEPIRIHTPFTEEDSHKLKIGDSVLITGEIYAARDAAHKKMCEALAKGEKLPIDWHNKMVYYLGPTPANRVIRSVPAARRLLAAWMPIRRRCSSRASRA